MKKIAFFAIALYGAFFLSCSSSDMMNGSVASKQASEYQNSSSGYCPRYDRSMINSSEPIYCPRHGEQMIYSEDSIYCPRHSEQIAYQESSNYCPRHGNRGMMAGGKGCCGRGMGMGMCKGRGMSQKEEINNLPTEQPSNEPAKSKDDVQVIKSTLSPYQYPNITVKVGTPVKWLIDAPSGSINGCNNRMFIREYGIEYTFKSGENVIEFTPSKTGKFQYTCWMGMIRATITVVD
jgi:hypothetical protein